MGFVTDFLVKDEAEIKRAKLAFEKEISIEEDFLYPPATSAGFLGANLRWNTSAGTVQTPSPQLHGGYVQLLTAGGGGGNADIFMVGGANAGYFDLDKNPTYKFLFYVTSINTVAAYAGLYLDGTHYAEVGFAAGTAPTWRFRSHDGTTGLVSTTTIPVAANKLYCVTLKVGDAFVNNAGITVHQVQAGVASPAAGLPLSAVSSSSHTILDDDDQVPRVIVTGISKSLYLDGIKVSVER